MNVPLVTFGSHLRHRTAGGLALCLLLGLLIPLAGCRSAEFKQADAAEVHLLVSALGLKEGDVVADVGAGWGEWAEALAQHVGPTGRVYATELDDEQLHGIRRRFVAAGIRNGEVLRGTDRETGLPAGCCDVVLLRRVYHHFVDPTAMNLSLRRALRPGGLLAVVDYSTYDGASVAGVPENRESHSVRPDIVVRETAEFGFEEVEVITPWNGRDDVYCLLLRRTE
ncbi:MAG: class I SAM-dependent methyltransferase [Acidobacteriota bacterium]